MNRLKVITGRFGGAGTHPGRLPTHGVYNLQDWEQLGEQAKALSLHWFPDTAMDAATLEEQRGTQCVVVFFDAVHAAKEQRASGREAIIGRRPSACQAP